MAAVVISAGHFLRSAYQLLTSTIFPKEQKEATENLILATIRVVAAIFVYSALYLADQHLEGTQLKVLATIGAFCPHPTATLIIRSSEEFESLGQAPLIVLRLGTSNPDFAIKRLVRQKPRDTAFLVEISNLFPQGRVRDISRSSGNSMKNIGLNIKPRSAGGSLLC